VPEGAFCFCGEAAISEQQSHDHSEQSRLCHENKKPFGTQLLSNFIIGLWFHFWQKFFSWKFVKVGKKFFGIF